MYQSTIIHKPVITVTPGVAEKIQPLNDTSLLHFIGNIKANRTFLYVALVATIAQFIVFKLLYPYADFFSDSYSYIYAAYANLDINIWPIGYSKFLRAFHFISYSDTALVGFQYFFLEVSALYFFFTLMQLFCPGKTTKRILFIFLFFNPLFLYLSNYVNSDPIFAALSLLWLTQLLWIIHRPRNYQLLLQALLLFFCFTVRNNAYYYPIIGILAFVFSTHGLKTKVIGIVLPFLFIIPFIIRTRDAAYELTGTKQFSLFTGWQMANNALYIYDKIKVNSNKLPTPETQELDKLAKAYESHTAPPEQYRELLSSYVGNFFIRQPSSPLKKYMAAHFHPRDEQDGVEAWGTASAVFADYGKWIIAHNKMAFVKYFMLVNTRNYFLPPLEKLDVYNLGMDSVESIAAYWFHYKSLAVTSFSNSAQGPVLRIYPVLFLLVNLYFMGALTAFLVKKKYTVRSKSFNRSIFLVTLFALANAGFCIFATIIVLRYQVFPMIVLLSFGLILFDAVEGKLSIQSPNNNQNDKRNLTR